MSRGDCPLLSTFTFWRAAQTTALAFLLLILCVELALMARRESQTWDEACHFFAGYNHWKSANVWDNPEHPPLVKLLAALPLLLLSLKTPPHAAVFS